MESPKIKTVTVDAKTSTEYIKKKKKSTVLCIQKVNGMVCEQYFNFLKKKAVRIYTIRHGRKISGFMNFVLKFILNRSAFGNLRTLVIINSIVP